MTTDTTRPNRILVQCNEKFCTIEYTVKNWTPQSSYPRPIVHRIWWSPSELLQSPSLLTPVLLAGTQPVNDVEGGRTPGKNAAELPSNSWSGVLICLERNSLHQMKLSRKSEPQLVPQATQLEGTPTKVIFSRRLNKLIVLSTKTESRSSRQRNRRTCRASG